MLYSARGSALVTPHIHVTTRPSSSYIAEAVQPVHLCLLSSFILDMTPTASEDNAVFVLTGTSAIHFSVLARFHPWPCPVCHYGPPCSASHLMLRLCCCCSSCPAVSLGALHLRWFHSTMMWSSAATTSASNYCCESGSGGRHFWTNCIVVFDIFSLLCGTNSWVHSAESGDLRLSHFWAGSLWWTFSDTRSLTFD